MTNFWEKQGQPAQLSVQPTVVLDEEVVQALQQEEGVDPALEEEDDMSSVMQDANLRLEMGRLYQMILQNDIFADTNADPRAIRNVQREIRKLVRGRMEFMLGMAPDQSVPVQVIAASQFNDLEVSALKMLASKITKGATEQPQEVPVAPAPVKKDGITSISGNLRPQAPAKLAPAKPTVAPKQAPKAPAAPAKTPPKAEESSLKKSIDQMTPEELAAHNEAAMARSLSKRAALPQNLIPHPTPQALEMMYMNLGQNVNVSSMRPYRAE